MTTRKKNTAAKRASTKKLIAEEPPIKSQPTYETSFTKTELVHLRDLASVFLPPDGSLTVSQALAKQEGRVVAEKLLFDKIVELCVKAKIPVGEAAPDYIVGLSENPTLGVFQMSHDAEEPSLEGLVDQKTVQLFSDDDFNVFSDDEDDD